MSKLQVIVNITSHVNNKFHVDFLTAQSYSNLVLILEVLNGRTPEMPEQD